MLQREAILSKLPPFFNRRDVLLHDQDVADIISGILATHNRYKKEYDKIGISFLGFTQRETGRNIWNFLKSNVKYRVEPESAQMLKSPSAIITPTINGRTNTSDCKNMSLFTGGVLDAINRAGGNINWCYRFASYKFLDKMPQHVFCVINPDTKNEIWVDAVLSSYDNKKQYYYKTDKKPNMALVSLAGTVGAKKAKKTAAEKAAKKAGKGAKKVSNKEKRKQFFKKLKEKAGKTGRIIVKYNPATVASRNAFLLLVKVNARSLATNLKKLKDRNNTEAQNLWSKIGGNVSTLNAAIDSGASKKRLGVICGVNTKETRFANATINPKDERFKPKFTPGSRVRQMAIIRTIQNPRGGTEAALTAFVPTVVAPAVPTTPAGGYSGGGYGGGGYGGGGNYPGYDDSSNNEPIATDEIDDSLLENIDDSGNIIGVDPGVTAAAISAAAPIVVLIVKILSKNKASTKSDDKNITDDLDKAGDAAGKEAFEDISKEADGITTPTGDKILEGIKQAPGVTGGGKFPIMPVLLIGGGLLAFTLLKKK